MHKNNDVTDYYWSEKSGEISERNSMAEQGS